MGNIALVVDSTADLTSEIITKCDVHVVPLKIRFADKEFIDGEITSDAFYRRLAEAEQLPKTSQPSPDEFSRLYRRLLEEYNEVISVHLSAGLSGTINAAYLAKEKLKGKIHIFDSKTISLGMSLLVMEAAKHIKAGLTATSVLERLNDARKNIETLFTLNTLEYLQKGGRIGKVQSIVGSLLSLKPIVRVGDEGIYHTYGTVRSQEKAIKGIVQAFCNLAKGRRQVKLAVAHGAAPEAGSSLKEALENAFQLKTSVFTQVGPVIGVHTGPGTIGAAIQFE